MRWRRTAGIQKPKAPAFPPRWHDHPYASAWTQAMGEHTDLADVPSPWPPVPDANGLALALYKATGEFRADWVHALLVLGADPHRELPGLERGHRTAMHALLELPAQTVVDVYRAHDAVTWPRTVYDEEGLDYAAFARAKAYGPRGSLGVQLAQSVEIQWAEEDAKGLAQAMAAALHQDLESSIRARPRTRL